MLHVQLITGAPTSLYFMFSLSQFCVLSSWSFMFSLLQLHLHLLSFSCAPYHSFILQFTSCFHIQLMTTLLISLLYLKVHVNYSWILILFGFSKENVKDSVTMGISFTTKDKEFMTKIRKTQHQTLCAAVKVCMQ